MTNRERWDVANPQKTLSDVVARASPAAGDVIVVTMAAHAGGATQVVDITTVHTAAAAIERFAASDLLRHHTVAVVPDHPPAGSVRADGGRRPRPARDYVVVTVVCRTGRVVPGAAEVFWAKAWRYANHFANAYDGDIYTLTPDGWTGSHDRRAGFTPALGASPAQALSAVR